MEGSDWFQEIVNKVKQRLNLFEIIEKFDAQNDFATMFNYIWNMPNRDHYFKIPEAPVQKINKEAENVRNIGNELFKKGRYDLARNLYNKSIRKSSLGDIESLEDCCKMIEDFENIDPINVQMKYNFKDLAFGYANRSAVNFRLHYHKECVLDINRAIFYGYPNVLKHKLIERKVKCYLAMDQKDNALACLKSYLSDEMVSVCPEDKKKYLMGIKSKCENGEQILTANEIPCKKLKYFRIPPAPYPKKVNPKIPVLSDAITLGNDPGKDGLVATRNIMPGEILATEESYSTIIYTECLKDFCFNCTVQATNPVPCPFCSKVIFCGEECFVKALKKFHYFECSTFSAICFTKGEIACSVFRYISSFSLNELKLSYKKAQTQRKLRFDDQNAYSPDSYDIIYHQETIKEKDWGFRYITAVMAVCIVKCLQKANYFIDAQQSATELAQSYEFVGEVALRHMAGFDYNMQTALGQDVDNDCIALKEKHVNIGKCVNGLLSYVSTSCNPNGLIVPYGDTSVLVALTYITKDSMISCTNVPCAILSKPLRVIYYEGSLFECACIACVEKWPVMEDASKNIFFKCSTCSNNILLNSEKCPHCKTSTTILKVPGKNDTNEFSSLKVLFKDVQESLNYVNGLKLDIQSGGQNDLEKIQRCLYLLSKFSILPSLMYYIVIEFSKDYYMSDSSQLFWE